MVKRCPRCERNLPAECFNKHKKRGLQGYCKECNASYSANAYANNINGTKDKIKARAVSDRIRTKNVIYDYLLQNPCVDCEESDPIVLDFDHIDPILKKSTISELVNSGAPLTKILKEIEKCEIRCANCHRRRTAIQFGWYAFRGPVT